MKMSSKAHTSHPGRLRSAALAGFLLALALVTGWGCSSPKAPDSSRIFLDEAFVTLFPELAEKLVPRGADYSGFALTDLESARQKAIQQSSKGAIIASPLVAAGTIGAKGRIISPFLPSPIASVSGIKTILYDYKSAYELMGARAGRVRAVKAGTAPCALVFQPNSMRGTDALESFRKGYARQADPESLTVMLIEPSATTVDLAGATMSAIGKAIAMKPACLVVALDDAARTIAALSEAKKIILFGDVTAWRETSGATRVFDYWLEGNPGKIADMALRLLESKDALPEASYLPLTRRARFPRIF